MLQKTDIIRILTDLNYPYKDMGGYVLTKGIYRGGQTLGSVAIYNNGLAVDFVEGERYTLVDFVSLCTGLKGESVKEWLVNRVDLSTLNEISKPTIKQPKVYSNNLLNSFLPIYDYFENRGINKNFLTEFKSGLIKSGQMVNRYTFPIFNEKSEIVGFVGRDTTNKSSIKWKILGSKTNFVWPLFLNRKDMEEKKSVYLLESIGDALSLYSLGIKNFIVLFGVEISAAIIKKLISLDLNEIIISLNNDENKVGNESSEKIRKKLLNYFDSSQVRIKIPEFDGCNDWNEILQKTNGPEYIKTFLS